MRTSAQFRTALTALLLFVAPAAGHAVRAPNPSGARSALPPDDGRLIAADGRALRSAVPLASLSTLTMASARQLGGPRLHALQTFEQAMGATTILWDETTGVPLRIVGAGVPVVSAMRDAQVAETAARAFLQRHLTVLAPGASIDDFTLLTNSLNGAGDLRTVAFAQSAAGLPVVGGAVFVSFKADRLFTAGSTASPNIRGIDASVARTATSNRDPNAIAAWLMSSSGVRTTVAAPSRRVVLPLIAVSGTIEYVVADEQVAMGALGARWRVWSDPRTGAPVARRSLRLSGQGIVAFDVPKRSPIFGYQPQPAPLANFVVNGQPVVSNLMGSIMWTGGTGTLMPSVNGSLVSVSNFQGVPATASLPLADAGTTVWTSTIEADQAQLAGYVAATHAKLFAKQFLNPSLPYLDQVLSVVVNEGNGGAGEDCNAYSTGDDIHFLPRSERCENTALLADVVHHEFGHSLHINSITELVGDFDSAASEALADFLALSMSEDPVLGLGFFVTRPDIAVRDLDPAYLEKRAPEDVTGEPHADGEILVGALWDLRKALIARLGKEAGVARALKIYYGIMERGIGIFTSYNEALVADDDNGNLADGTPNQCAITAAFAHHGLTNGQPLALPTAPPPTRNGFVVETTLTPGSAAALGCGDAKVVDGEVTWKVRGKTGDGSQGTVPVTAMANGTTGSATLPTQPAGTVVQYQMRVALDDGTTLRFPDNAADPFYEFYVGDAKPIWCAEFEGADTPAVMMTGDWMIGKPMGPGAGNVGGDPAAAFV
ncbi:MAG TPA: hypothetical protein PLF40_21380, partial [Kofleriaceae bacterium]|nr:hypothetical protein [Kofleriaceae bacterium]